MAFTYHRASFKLACSSLLHTMQKAFTFSFLASIVLLALNGNYVMAQTTPGTSKCSLFDARTRLHSYTLSPAEACIGLSEGDVCSYFVCPTVPIKGGGHGPVCLRKEGSEYMIALFQ